MTDVNRDIDIGDAEPATQSYGIDNRCSIGDRRSWTTCTFVSRQRNGEIATIGQSVDIAIFFTVAMGGMITQPIRMLSQITQIESGTVKLQLEFRELKELKSYIFNLFDLAQEDSDLTLEWNVPEVFPAVLADKRFMERVFVNLNR